MSKKSIKNLFINLFLFINIISTMGIPCLGNYIDNISYYYFIVSVTSGIFVLLLKQKFKIKGFFIFACLYYLILLIPTIIYKKDLYLLLCEMGMNIITILIWNSMNKSEFNKHLPILSFALEILTYLNFMIILLYPDSLFNQGSARNYYLFGHVNITIRYLLPGCCFNMLRSIIKNNRIDLRSKIYFIIVCLTLILTLPVTAIVGTIIFVISFIILIKNKASKFLNPINGFYGSLAISLLIVYARIQNLFNRVIVSILHKDLTLSGRTRIWNIAIEMIKSKFILGYGRLNIQDRIAMFNATSAHNQFFIFLTEGGICLLALMFFLIKSISKNMKKCNNKLAKATIVSVIISYLYMWITEPFSYSGTILMFLVFLIAYYGNICFDKNLNNEGEPNE